MITQSRACSHDHTVMSLQSGVCNQEYAFKGAEALNIAKARYSLSSESRLRFLL